MTKGDLHLRGLALREQNREFYETLPKAKGYSVGTKIVAYIRMVGLVCEVPFIIYYILREKKKHRQRRA
jgi:hypothetical protein